MSADVLREVTEMTEEILVLRNSCIQIIFVFKSFYIFDYNAADERLLLETRVQHTEIGKVYDWHFVYSQTTVRSCFF